MSGEGKQACGGDDGTPVGQTLEDACRDPSGWLEPSGLDAELAAGMPKRCASADADERGGIPDLSVPDSEHIRWLLEKSEVVTRRSHFVYASGKHGPDYVAKDKAMTMLFLVKAIAKAMAKLVPQETEVLAAPAVAGVALLMPVAYEIASREGSCVPFVTWAEKKGDGFVFRDSHLALIPGSKIAILEDIVTTAGSVSKVEDAVVAAGGEVIRAVCIWNRGRERTTSRGTALEAVVEAELPMFPADTCPLCAAGVPIDTRFGHGAAYLARKASG